MAEAVNQLFNYLLLALNFSLAFLIFPASRRAPRDRVPCYDVVRVLAVIGVDMPGRGEQHPPHPVPATIS